VDKIERHVRFADMLAASIREFFQDMGSEPVLSEIASDDQTLVLTLEDGSEYRITVQHTGPTDTEGH
jgi:hypothetical protein